MTTTYTLAEIEAELSDLADYEELASVSRAREFVTWARRWLIQQPRNQEDENSVLTMSPEEVRRLLVSAQAFVAQNADANSNSNAGARFFSFEDFRD